MDHYRWLNQESHGQLEIPGNCSNIFDILIYIYILLLLLLLLVLFLLLIFYLIIIINWFY